MSSIRGSHSFIWAALGCLLAAGCGSENTAVDLASVIVTVTPDSPTVVLGGTVQFSATITGSSNKAVTWSVREGIEGGSVSDSGLYTAPMTPPGEYHVDAASKANGIYTGTARVTVRAPCSPPTITHVAPMAGAPGTSVTISGTNFCGSPVVKFNGTPTTVSSSEVEIIAIVPTGATDGPISVTTLDGSATSSMNFRILPFAPTFTFSPDHGVRDDIITLSGMYLATTRHVKIHGAEAVFQVISDMQVHATVPRDLSIGPGTISVETDGGIATSNGFNIVQAAPSISSFDPTHGDPGDAVHVHGLRFVNVQHVMIAGLEASFSVVDETRIDTSVPAGAQPSAMPIRVTTPDGTATSSTDFIVNGPAPVVTSFSPTSGVPGDTIDIFGENFIGVVPTSGVKFNTVNALRFTVIDSTHIRADVNGESSTGPIHVITAVGGEGVSSTPFTVYGAFSATASGLVHPRASHTATLLDNGKVLLVGGLSPTAPTATAEIYDPVANSFSDTGSMTDARAFHTATKLTNGKVLITGGGTSSASLDTAEIYDPDSGMFTPLDAHLGAMRRQHTATLLSTNKVLIAGGITGASTSLNTAELFDPSDNSFSPTGNNMGGARSNYTATVLAPDVNKVLLVGGPALAGTTADLFDPTTGMFSSAGTYATARAGHAAVLLNNGRVVITGGLIGNEGLLYTPGTGFSTFPAGIASGIGQASVVLNNGRAFVVGGNTSGNRGRLYNPANNDILLSGTMAAARNGHTATHLNNGKVLVAGGAGAAATTASLYDYGAGP